MLKEKFRHVIKKNYLLLDEVNLKALCNPGECRVMRCAGA
jgi:hypothetical protein